MKILKITISVFLLFIFISNTSTAWQRQERDVDSFNGIALGISATVYLKQGATQSVVIEGDDDELEDIETRVKGETLVIEYDGMDRWFSWGSRHRVDIYITVKELREVSVSGSGKIEGESDFTCEDLELDVSGSGKIELDVNAEDIYMSISGSGRIELDGSSDRNEIRISGSGDLSAEDLQATAYDIRISGSGKAKVDVKEEIYARISGSGSVYYRGDPDRVRSDVSGSGKVRRL